MVEVTLKSELLLVLSVRAAMVVQLIVHSESTQVNVVYSVFEFLSHVMTVSYHFLSDLLFVHSNPLRYKALPGRFFQQFMKVVPFEGVSLDVLKNRLV